jgi:hypothetical protein
VDTRASDTNDLLFNGFGCEFARGQGEAQTARSASTV